MHRKEKAILLRRAGKSYREISDQLGISKGTLSGWFNGKKWSVAIQKQLTAATNIKWRSKIQAMSRARSLKFAALREKARMDARIQFNKLSKNQLFTSGVALYWGEGDKSPNNGSVRLGNADPALVQMFAKFLTKCCNVPHQKMRAWVLLYPDLSPEACQQYWSSALNIPPSQFHKTQKIQGRSKKRVLTNGMCYIQVSDRLLKERIIEWIQCLQLSSL